MKTGESSDVNNKLNEISNTKKSFFYTMLDEKGLLDEVLEVSHEGVTHFIEMAILLEGMENTTPREQNTIEMTMRKIDFLNKDMMDYMNHLAKAFIIQHY